MYLLSILVKKFTLFYSDMHVTWEGGYWFSPHLLDHTETLWKPFFWIFLKFTMNLEKSRNLRASWRNRKNSLKKCCMIHWFSPPRKIYNGIASLNLVWYMSVNSVCATNQEFNLSELVNSTYVRISRLVCQFCSINLFESFTSKKWEEHSFKQITHSPAISYIESSNFIMFCN